jgi:hypothetical protein
MIEEEPLAKEEEKLAADKYSFGKPEKIFLSQKDLALIEAAMTEEMPFGKIFTCAIDKGGEHLECEVDYDGEFLIEGEDIESTTVQDWVRISVLHPRYLLYMANIMVRMKDGMLNFDEEIKSDIFQDPKMISEKLIAFLNAILIPAIKLRVSAGKNPNPFSRESAPGKSV